MRVKVIAYTPDPERIIAAAALTTVRKSIILPESVLDDEIDSIIDAVIRRGHHSVLEHANFTFAIEGISRVTCYDEETEVLTKEGWKPIKDVSVDDYVACLDDNMKLIWHKPKAKIIQNYRGPMIRVRNEAMDLLVTPGHMMWLKVPDLGYNEWRFIPVEEIKDLKSYVIMTGVPGDKHFERRIQAHEFLIEHYEGNVYSLVVPYHRLYVKRKGKSVWSGNSHQLVRHRIASYSQQSQRYVPIEEPMAYVPSGVKKVGDQAVDLFESAMRSAWEIYRKLIDLGVDPEEARYVLPQATKTNMIVTMNARELLHFFSLRLCYRAQEEIRRLAVMMLKEVYRIAPRVFKHAGPRCKMLGYCPEEYERCPLYKTFRGRK